MSVQASSTGPLAGVQRLVARGYKFHACLHLILKVTDTRLAQQWLAALVQGGWLAWGDETWPAQEADLADHLAQRYPLRTPLSLGLTFHGLAALGLDERTLDVLTRRAPAFAQGAAARAAAHLGDVDDSAVERWDARFDAQGADLLVLLHGDDLTQLHQAARALWQLAGADGLTGWESPLEAAHLGQDRAQRREHFGLLDGLSSPQMLFGEAPPDAPWPDPRNLRHRAGEFILGHANNQGLNPWRLVDEQPACHTLSSGEQSAGLARFFRDGSFAALRMMAQDVPAFNGYLDESAAQLKDLGVPDTRLDPRPPWDALAYRAYLRAKLLGRWEDGQVIGPGQYRAPGSPGPAHGLNDFDFSQDAQGLGCPFGAHIRRMNPRSDPVVPFRRRPILRRGMPYGPAQGDGERGLLGLFFCASLEHQFEHLVGQWAEDTPMGPDNRGNARDPLIGRNDPSHHLYDIPLDGGPAAPRTAVQLDGLKPFVRTRGTLYALFPGRAALQWLSGQDPCGVAP